VARRQVPPPIGRTVSVAPYVDMTFPRPPRTTELAQASGNDDFWSLGCDNNSCPGQEKTLSGCSRPQFTELFANQN
jgi:hypothetical protein